MTRFGYTMMTEQCGPKDLVRHAVAAEAAGFDFAVCSDHYSPWLTEQGHAPYAWSVLGAAAHATSRIELMTYVTCPTMRYHPAVVAQKAATLQLLADGRFTLGLGSGERLNEHVVGEGWRGVETRQRMLAEAIGIIRELHTGQLVTRHGRYYQVESARVWDVPHDPVPIGVAVSGQQSIELLAPLADHMIAVEPAPESTKMWHDVRAAQGVAERGRVIGQLPVCWDEDASEAVARAHRQFRWFAGGWPVNAELPTPASFAAATQFVQPADVAEAFACGSDLDAMVDAVRPFWEAGFTDIALVQIGGDTQDEFFAKAARPLLEKLRNAAP